LSTTDAEYRKLKVNEALRVDSNKKIEFRDAAIFIYSAADGYLDLDADVGIRFGVAVGATTFGADVTISKTGAPGLNLTDEDETSPAGKFRVENNNDLFYISSRNAGDAVYEAILTAESIIDGGRVYFYGSDGIHYDQATEYSPEKLWSGGGAVEKLKNVRLGEGYKETLPESVLNRTMWKKEDGTEYERVGFRVGKTIGFLLAIVKEQQAKIKALEQRIGV